MKVPIEVSARHIHLSQKDLEILFGPGFQLTKIRDLSQVGEFATQETVTLISQESSLEGVRVIGPIRQQTQVEISATEARKLSINPPLRVSGDLNGSAGITVKGPNGAVELKEGVVLAWRHLHMSEEEAKKFKLKDRDFVSIKVEGNRGLIFEKVVVRVSPSFRLSFQIDTDEGNAAGIDKFGQGTLLSK